MAEESETAPPAVDERAHHETDHRADHRARHQARNEAQDEALSEAFWGVARQLRSTSREALAPWDISPSHSRAIGVLTRHGVMRLSELSEHLRIAPRSTTEVVDALEERGLIVRTPDARDRRATLVSLTDEGLKVADSIRESREAEAQRFFGTLSEEDRRHLTRILLQLRR